MVIIVDMDDVVADAGKHMIELYNKEFNTNYTRENLNGKLIYNVIPKEHIKTFISYPHRKGFFRNLSLIPNSVETIKKLSLKHEIFFVSAAMEFKHSLIDKFEWIDENFPFIKWENRVLCGNKKIIKGHFMIDDLTKNLDTFDGEKILFSADHNLHINKYNRANNWLEVEKFIMKFE